MTTVWPFLAKFASLIVCTLHCFDRVIFKGHLALSSARELERFVDCVLKVRRSHFMNVILPEYSEQLVEHAKRFAAKEALAKAFGTGIRHPVSLSHIRITHDHLGKPYFTFHPALNELARNEGITRHHLSISDELNLACAFVILEK